jgi:KUP system potassium uptake protein
MDEAETNSQSKTVEKQDETTSSTEPPHPSQGHGSASIIFLAFAALGVVYGDIGTSPLYALKECFHGIHAIDLNRDNILGVLSLVFWSLTMVVSIKYITFIMRADNHGEGGIFALLALTPIEISKISARTRSIVVYAALMSASLLYGDGIITPAISVLSAVEGLEVATHAASGFTVPITCVILFALFFMQSKGTASIGKVFGPVMVLWFLTISILGISQIFQHPDILVAINPFYAFRLFALNHYAAFVVLGSVVLCITGGEALYADMGHFGRRPIRLSWFCFVFPALLFNYFGQGALLLHNPEVSSNPFYGLVPKSLIIPMVVLATSAAVIASQALISGAFSVTRQAIQLGFLPRLNIIHTSEHTQGQIYIPFINKAMMIGCISIVLIFKESSRLAAAYGIAVTTDMVLTSTVFFFVITKTWNWPLRKAVPLVMFFLFFDLLYFSSNLLKFFDGGWFPVLLASCIFIIMFTWKDGRVELAKRMRAARLPIYKTADGTASLKHIPGTTQLFEPTQHMSHTWLPIELITGEMASTMERVPGTAVFLTVSLKSIPPVMLHHLNHNHVLHEQVILLSIKSKEVPTVSLDDTLEITEVGYGFFQIVAFYGFMQTPNVPEIMAKAIEFGLRMNPETTTYFLGREALVLSRKSKMQNWRKSLFAFMSRNAQPATAYFNLPPSRVIEIGMQVEL